MMFVFTSIIARIVYMGADMAENVGDIKRELILMHKVAKDNRLQYTMGNTQQIAPESPKQPEPPKEFQIYCSECGAVNPNGRTNCFNCGAKLHD